MQNILKLLFIGDVVGENGLDNLIKKFPSLKEKYEPNFIVVNGENIWEGKGLNEAEANRLFKAGTDVITTGNHIWDNWKSRPLLQSNPKVIRPLNYPEGNAGNGYYIAESQLGVKVAVLQLQGRTYMSTIDCPFRAADKAIEEIRKITDVIIVDFHAEATAEKAALAYYLDGKVSAILGTHTHVQTADACIFPNGTAFISDVGMTGPYNSVLGMKVEVALSRFLLQTAHKFEMAEDDLRIAGCNVNIDIISAKALNINSFVSPPFERG